MCGFVGIVSSASVASEIHVGLQAIQHRGQDSAGIATMEAAGDRFHARRGQGTVDRALDEGDVASLAGPVGVGHVRYPTIGGGGLADAQPFFYRQPGVLMAHNGQLTNYAALRQSLLDRSIHLLSHCDVEPALCELADALMDRRKRDHTAADAVAAARTMAERIRGAYSMVAVLMLDGVPTLMVVRDPYGLRPVVIGERDGSYIAASESVALDALGFKRLLTPAGGEVVLLRHGEAPQRFALDAPPAAAPCSFEHIYFARPDSELAGRSVYETRLALGQKLAARVAAKGIDADVVVAVPDTARPAATALAEALDRPLREGFIKNRYSGRTFIMPDASSRGRALRLKLNPLPGEVRDRRVLLVDDSIVRGTTLRRVVALLRATGVREVHLAIHSPPVRHPCFYGIDMSTEEELFARRFEGDLDRLERDAAAELDADSLTYLPVADLDAALGAERCAACFDGSYPAPLSSTDISHHQRDRAEHHNPSA